MGFITDYAQLNAADDYQDWTYDNWSPTDNNVNSNTPIYIEGSSCQWWPHSKGVTDGYVYAAVTGSMVNGKILVWWWNYMIADAYNIPLTNMRCRICSTNWTTNFREWDAKAQLYSPFNVPISGHVPVMVYPTNPNASPSNGTLVTTSLSHVGLIGTTGNTADGKQGGFDMVFLIGYIGLHSETHTNTFFDELYEQAYDDQGATELPVNADRPLGIISRAGDFFQSNVKFQLGDGTADTANLVVSEDGKTIYWNNVEPEHELGYVFVDPASTHEVRLTLTGGSEFWNSQLSTHEIFTGAENATYFKIDGRSFSNGGKATLPSYSINRWVKNSKFSNCGEVTPKDGTFEGNTIASATSGVKVTGTLATNRMKNNVYSGNTDGMHFDTAQTITLDGDKFSGNTTDIHFSGSGTLTVNATNGANPVTSRVTGGGTVVINNNKVHTLIGLKENSEVTYTAKPAASDSGVDGASTAGSRNFVTTNAWTVDEHQGRLLVIGTGADAGRYYIVSNTATTLKLDAELSATAGSLSYSIYGAFTVVDHTENVPADGENEYSYGYSGDTYVDILVFHVNYVDVVLEDVLLGDADQTIPIGQIIDVNYFNPT